MNSNIKEDTLAKRQQPFLSRDELIPPKQQLDISIPSVKAKVQEGQEQGLRAMGSLRHKWIMQPQQLRGILQDLVRGGTEKIHCSEG